MSIDISLINRLDKNKVSYFKFKRLKNNYLITNDTGDFVFLNDLDFSAYIDGSIEKKSPKKFEELKSKHFFRDWMDFETIIKKYSNKSYFLGTGTSLHIVVLTLNCNQKCIYCQSGSEDNNTSALNMTTDIAKLVVDQIFKSPNPDITIEFQGGEPLLNFETLKFIVQYAKKLNKKFKKNLLFTVVSNLTLMDENKFNYFLNNRIALCTSIDGHELLHKINRVSPCGDKAFRTAKQWFRKILNAWKSGSYPHKPHALLTVTKHSLKYPKQIVESYLELGCDLVFLRPLSPLGLAQESWSAIGYTPEAYISFYKKALDYIIQLNKKGICFKEQITTYFLSKILGDKDPNFLDLRSPCGAITGQLAYNYNGDIYTCDEARMLGRMGDDTFKIGNVFDGIERTNYENSVKALCSASILDNLPGCSQCVYSPYCGVCPVLNYALKGNIFGHEPNNFKSRINSMQLDYIFEKIQNPDLETIFKRWIQ